MEEIPSTLLFVRAVAVLAPIIAAAPLPMRLPMVVLEIVLGMRSAPGLEPRAGVPGRAGPWRAGIAHEERSVATTCASTSRTWASAS